MKRKALAMMVLLLCLSAVVLHRTPVVRHSKPQPFVTAGSLNLQQAYGQLPLTFEMNRRAGKREAYFVSRGKGYNLFLQGSDAMLGVGSTPESAHVITMRLLGANPQPRASGVGIQRARSNYLIGANSRNWRVGIPNYERVLLENVYPGVDLTYYGKQGDLEYDFIVSPGSDPHCIRLAFQGVQSVSFDHRDLLLQTPAGKFRLHEPLIYQLRNGNKQPVQGRFRLVRGNEVSFDIGAYDRRRGLVIDPGLVYSTYLGGGGRDDLLAIAVDRNGSAYVTGSTTSLNFPVTAAGLQKALGRGDKTVFVTKLNPTGTAIEYSTYVGGNHSNVARAIAVNTRGEAYIAGSTLSSDFPVTRNALQPRNAGALDAFVARLSADGSRILYSTYLGGKGDDEVRGIALDSADNAYITGSTRSADFPGSAAQLASQDCAGSRCQHAFAARLNGSGTALVYSRLLGGSSETSANSIALDLSGAAYVAGSTSDPHFLATAGALQLHTAEHAACIQTRQDCADVFVSKLSSQGAVLYSGRLGGSADQRANAITVDDTGAAYVTGRTDSQDFPTTHASFQATAPNHSATAFVFKLDPLGSKLLYSTFLGGAQDDEAKAIALDSARNLYVAGVTSSVAFPTTSDALQARLSGSSAAFLSRLDPRGSSLQYSTMLGGSGSDLATAVAIDSRGNVFLAGSTESSDFPLEKPLQNTLSGERNAFVAKFSSDALSAPDATTGIITAAPAVTLSSTSAQFLNQKPGTVSAAQSVTLTNSGTAALTSIVVSLTGTNAADFAVTTTPATNCGGTLAVSASCTLAITFKPATTGVRLATISISDNAANTPQTVQLTGNPPVASVSTKSLTFPSQPEGRLSPYQAVTLKNTALYTALHVSGIALSAGNYQQANNCPVNLAANASCTVTVAFMPISTGTLTANLNFSDNSLNNSASTQTVALSGTATAAPVASFSAYIVNFGTVNRGSRVTRNITLTNTGVGTLIISNFNFFNAGDFQVTTTGTGVCTFGTNLAAGASCTLPISFGPSISGSESAQLQVIDNSGNLAGSLQNIAVIGTGTGVAQLAFSAIDLDFGSVQMGSASAQKIVQLTNVGTVPLSNIFINSNGTGDFQVQSAAVNNCSQSGSLAVGASCNVAIVFTPTMGAAGVRSASFSAAAFGIPSSPALYLTGTATGVAIATLSTYGLNFGTVNVGSASTQRTLTIQNTGNIPLTFSGANVGNDFVLVPLAANNCNFNNGVLAPGASCQIAIVFEPRSSGTISELLAINDNSNASGPFSQSQYVALMGTGNSVTPGLVASLSSNALNFGNQPVGVPSTPQVITLTNSGTIPWQMFQPFGNNNYSMTSTCSTLNPGSSCTLTVYFIPTALGPQPLAPTLQLSSQNSFSNVALVFTGNGTGTQSETVSSTALNFGTATSGLVGSSLPVTLTNTGDVGIPMSVSILPTTQQFSSPDFLQSDNCPQFGNVLPPQSSCTVIVSFAPNPGLPGTRQALLLFQGGPFGTPIQQIVTLTGTAAGMPHLTATPSPLTFLDQAQGTSSTARAVTLSNTGTAPAPLNVSVSNSFSLLFNGCPLSLAVGAHCTIYTVFNAPMATTFTPGFFSPVFGSIVIGENLGIAPQQQTVLLSGVATPTQ